VPDTIFSHGRGVSYPDSGIKSAFTDISAAQQGQACYCGTCHRLMHLIHPVLYSVNRLPLPQLFPKNNMVMQAREQADNFKPACSFVRKIRLTTNDWKSSCYVCLSGIGQQG